MKMSVGFKKKKPATRKRDAKMRKRFNVKKVKASRMTIT
jgi:hypothetical protein